MADTTFDLRDIEPYFRGKAKRVYDVLRDVPAFGVSATFLGDLVKALDDFRQNHGVGMNAAEFRLKINQWICRLVLEVGDADCVFIRRIQSDGSVKLYGEPAWSLRPKWGMPPENKAKNEGVSGRILNSGITGPVLIAQVQAENNPYWDDHQATLQHHFQGAPAHTFVSHIKAEFCVPLTVRHEAIAGVVGVRWNPYPADQAELVKADLAKWQGIFADLYYAGLQLERREDLQQRIREYTAISSAPRAPLSDEEFLREMVTVLTCEAGLRWHRAFVFLFEGRYPSSAQCVIAIGGTGDASWSRRQAALGGLSLEQSLQRTRAADYANDDPLFRLATSRPAPLTVPKEAFAGHPFMDRLFATGPQGPECVAGGLAILEPNDAWFMRLAWRLLACVDGARDCRRYVCPLLRPARRVPLGFVLLDNPYPRPRETPANLSGTRLLCDGFAGNLADRGIGVDRLHGLAPPPGNSERWPEKRTGAQVLAGSEEAPDRHRSDLRGRNEAARSGEQETDLTFDRELVSRESERCDCERGFTEDADRSSAGKPRRAELEMDFHDLINKSIETFEKELPGLLREHEGKWVAYVGAQQVAFGDTQSQLVEQCRKKGHKDQELFMSRIEPDLPTAYAGWER